MLRSPELLRKRDGLRPTAYLDGLRGFAALLVVIHHWADAVHNRPGYGYGQTHEDYDLMKLPIIRLIYGSGHAMVCVFFIISGYALAYKPVEHIHAKRYDALLRNLASSIVRRTPRLMLPALAITFMVMLLINFGFYDHRAMYFPSFTRLPTLWEQLVDWYNDALYVADPFSWDFIIWTKYQPHTWTLNVELHGSLWIYMMLLFSARLRPLMRQRALLLWVGYCILRYKVWVSLFAFGLWMADREFLEKHNDVEKQSSARRRGGPLPVALFVAGVYLMSVPIDGHQATALGWGWIWKVLSAWIPDGGKDDVSGDLTGDGDRRRVCLTVGSMLATYAVSQLDALRDFFEIGANQYLGKVSFALYLVHGPIIYCIGNVVFPAMLILTGTGQWDVSESNGSFPDANKYMKELAALAALAILMPIFLWAADLFERFVDKPSVEWSKRIANAVMLDD